MHTGPDPVAELRERLAKHRAAIRKIADDAEASIRAYVPGMPVKPPPEITPPPAIPPASPAPLKTSPPPAPVPPPAPAPAKTSPPPAPAKTSPPAPDPIAAMLKADEALAKQLAAEFAAEESVRAAALARKTRPLATEARAPALICSATGWHNNCGLNCLTHFLAKKIENGDIHIFDDDPSYEKLLSTFQDYYHLPNKPSWDDIREKFQQFPNPLDREAIFAPVLRKLLGEIIAQKADLQWAEGYSALIDNFITTGDRADVISPIIRSNSKFFEGLRRRYLDEPTAANLATLMQEAGENWIMGGSRRFGDYMGDLLTGEPVSAQQLHDVVHYLHMSANIVSPNGDEYVDADALWNFTLYNRGGMHWEYSDPNLTSADVRAHNLQYDEHEQASRFRILSMHEEGARALAERIITTVHDSFRQVDRPRM